MEPIFEGSAVALVLPMFDNGDIDFEGFKKQVQRMIDGGVQALLVNGTTGETATITMEDEFELLDITLKMAKGTGVKVIAGAGSNDTATALTKAKKAKEKSMEGQLKEEITLAIQSIQTEEIYKGNSVTLETLAGGQLEKELKVLQKKIVNQKAKQDDRVTKTIQEYQEKKAYYENHPLVVNYLYLQNEVNEILQTINQQMNNALK